MQPLLQDYLCRPLFLTKDTEGLACLTKEQACFQETWRRWVKSSLTKQYFHTCESFRPAPYNPKTGESTCFPSESAGDGPHLHGSQPLLLKACFIP